MTQLDRIERSLERIERLLHAQAARLDLLLLGEKEAMADLTNLTAEVAANTSVTGSAIALIQGFGAQLAAAGTDQTKLDALQASLKASTDALAAAVAANTPAAPAAPPAPPAPVVPAPAS